MDLIKIGKYIAEKLLDWRRSNWQKNWIWV